MNLGTLILNAITAGVIPFIVQLLKKFSLPTKAAPWVALGIAMIVVICTQAFAGQALDFMTVLGIIAQGLGVGAISVFGYDIWKVNQPVTTEKK